jgi:hypothetical protein
MRMPSDSSIDPRYAAQFQRDYDPTRDAAPVARAPMRLEGGPPATAPRVPDPPPMVRTPPVDEVADSRAPGYAEPPSRRALTGWDWLLPGIGAAFILIAFMMWWSVGTDTGAYFRTAETEQWGVFLQQVRYLLPEPLLVAGVLALTGGIVLQTVRPRG